jgi:hypothetical protein
MATLTRAELSKMMRDGAKVTRQDGSEISRVDLVRERAAELRARAPAPAQPVPVTVHVDSEPLAQAANLLAAAAVRFSEGPPPTPPAWGRLRLKVTSRDGDGAIKEVTVEREA